MGEPIRGVANWVVWVFAALALTFAGCEIENLNFDRGGLGGQADGEDNGSSDDDSSDAEGLGNIINVARANGSFTTLLAALDATDLTAALEGDGPFTVFAPTDDAFAALPAGTVEALLADPEALANILLYHVVAGAVPAADVVNLESATTLNGADVSIRVEGGNVFINDSQVIIVDVPASNGVIHVIDAVLLPPAPEPEPEPEPEPLGNIIEVARANGSFTTLLAALDATDLTGALEGDGPFTVFAPTDDAFAALPAGTVEALLADPEALANILLYHVVAGAVPAADVVNLESATTLNGADVSIRVEGGNVFINDSQVIIVDVPASNGVIHVIDAVLLPPAPEPEPEPEPEPLGNIIEVARANGSFTTLLAALDATDLTGALEGDGPFTVFAPTDDAFAALPAGTVEALLADPEALANILLYHVVAGAVPAADVVNLESATTLNGADVSIRVEGGNVFINDSQVIIVDVPASNGVIHVIDAVLLPPAPEPEFGEGTPIRRGYETLHGAFGADEDDVYFFTADDTSNLRIETYGCHGDTVVTVYSAAGELVAEGNDNGCADLHAEVELGDYVVVVSGAGGDAVRSYRMTFSLSVDVNDGGAFAGAFDEHGNDLFAFNLERGGQLSFETNDGEGGCPGDTEIEVYQVTRWGSWRVARDRNDGPGACAALDGHLRAGSYVVVVSGGDGEAVGGYNVDVAFE